ncbi:MAG: SdrD B-like domain-containing protein [Candidatus Anammoxibacter sp.]
MNESKGFTLIEIIVILTIFGIMIRMTVPAFFSIEQSSRENHTIEKLNTFRKAMVGTPVIVMNEARTSFGFLGDMGNFPDNLGQLYKKGTQSSYSFNTDLKIGTGWDGPYIDPKIIEDMEFIEKDEFGNNLEYTTIPYTNNSVGQLVEARIRSKGNDKIDETADDLSVEFYKTNVKSTVFGFVTLLGKRNDGAEGIAGVNVTMNEPFKGQPVEKIATTDSKGFYLFDDITYGNRSITVNPKLVLTVDSAKVTGQASNDVEFSVTNYSANDISITSVTPVFDIEPSVYFKTLKIGNSNVFMSTSPRVKSGDTISFGARTVEGGGGIKETFPIRIQSPVTEVADLPLGFLGIGATLKIEMLDFVDALTGNGNTVDMTGVLFVYTFSDGSVISLTPGGATTLEATTTTTLPATTTTIVTTTTSTTTTIPTTTTIATTTTTTTLAATTSTTTTTTTTTSTTTTTKKKGGGKK